MEQFLNEDQKTTILDNSATIEALLEALAKSKDHDRYQVWDELITLLSSFGLYKPGTFTSSLLIS